MDSPAELVVTFAELVFIYTTLVIQARFHIVYSFRESTGPSPHTTSSSSGTGRTPLLLGDSRTEGGGQIEMSFGVGELLSLLDLEVAVCVGADVFDEDRLAARLNPGRGQLEGGL